MTEATRRERLIPAALATALVVATLLGFLALSALDSDRFYRAVQEDEALEWATFWAFLAAAGAYLHQAVLQRGSGVRFPWFLTGVAAFCGLVAMEEISWGQRLLGFQPPQYFLEHNYQQELNLHNVVARSWSALALLGVTLGYGVALPLLALVPPLRRLLDRLSIVAPPVLLAPAFATAAIAFETYPMRFAGEIVECMLGLSFLFAALLGAARRATLAVALSAGLVLGLALASAHASWLAHGGSPELLEAARVEMEALRRDVAQRARLLGRAPVHCGFEDRLYTFRRDHRADWLEQGAFAALRARGLPESRQEFFLDPWSSPYWLRHKCSDDGSVRVVYLYSFGPNRRRDSTDWERGGDDLRVTILERRRGD